MPRKQKIQKKAPKIVCRVPSMPTAVTSELMVTALKAQGYTRATYHFAWECRHYHILAGAKA